MADNLRWSDPARRKLKKAILKQMRAGEPFMDGSTDYPYKGKTEPVDCACVQWARVHFGEVAISEHHPRCPLHPDWDESKLPLPHTPAQKQRLMRLQLHGLVNEIEGLVAIESTGGGDDTHMVRWMEYVRGRIDQILKDYA